MNRVKSTGFTIVELLIVIVIIGVLAAITIVTYSGIQDRATQALLQNDLRQAATSLEIAMLDTGEYPPEGSEDDFERSPGVHYQYSTDGSSEYCLTASHDNASVAFNVSQTNQIEEGACLGHSIGGGGSAEPGRQVFTYSGTFTPPEGIDTVNILVVGGGGGGGAAGSGGGGGGGGQVRWETDVSVSGSVDVVVGAGGQGIVTGPSTGNKGQSSSFGDITAAGGGGGGAGNGNSPTSGASGGGGAGHYGGGAHKGANGTAGGAGGDGWGGEVYLWRNAGGGGGGAGGDGTTANHGEEVEVNPAGGIEGHGGVGLDMSSYVGTDVGHAGWFGGGGGGARVAYTSMEHGNGGGGGQGGGGRGGRGGADYNVHLAADGTANTGGGGGGSSGAFAPNRVSGSGGSGVVIVVWGDYVASSQPSGLSRVAYTLHRLMSHLPF